MITSNILAKNKIISIEKLKKILPILKKNKKKIGLCHGVFDLVHYGHIKHFEEAKKKCDILIVSVTKDEFIKKGPGRPFFKQNQRLESLANLSLVDYVIISNSPTAINNIMEVKPTYYFKGPDYKNSKDDITKNILLEKKAVKKVNGTFYITKSVKYSSSNLINKNLNIFDKKQNEIISKIKNKFSYLEIKKKIEDLNRIKALILGEVIIDQYFFCEALGKSGKEPILVIKDKYNETYLGGAAAICNHVFSFCKNLNFLSMIGKKKEFFKFIKQNLPKKINIFFLKKKNSPTIIKKRFIDEVNKSKILGVYSLNDNLINKVQEQELKKSYLKLSKNVTCTILSDYGHGMISPNIIKLIQKNSKFLSANVQVNAANVGYHTLKNYRNIDLMITNETEIRHEMRSKEEKIESLMKRLSKNQKIKYFVVTRGSSGVILYNLKTNKFHYVGAFATKIVDKVGAGDAMLSLLSLCLSQNIDIDLSLFLSSLAAAQSVATMGNKKSINKLNILKDLEHMLQ